MEEQRLTSGAEVMKQLDSFKAKMKQIRPNSKGRYISNLLPMNTWSLDPQLRPKTSFFSKIQRIFTSQTIYQRPYLLYIPDLSHNLWKLPLILLLHGTNQTMFNSQLTIQENKLAGWFDYADHNNFAIIMGQSRGMQFKGKMYYGWQPGNQDISYLYNLIEEIEQFNDKNKMQQIDLNSISLVGFSNGGLFTSDLYLNYISCKNLKFRIKIFINYMGGIQYNIDQQVLAVNKQKRQTPIIIMTCQKQENYGPCLRAKNIFEIIGCNVSLIEVDVSKHEFVSSIVDIMGNLIISVIKEDQ